MLDKLWDIIAGLRDKPKVITVTLPDPPPLKFVFADNGRFAIVIYEN